MLTNTPDFLQSANPAQYHELEIDSERNLRLGKFASLQLAHRAVSLIYPWEALVAEGTFADIDSRERLRIGDVMWLAPNPQAVDYWFNADEGRIILDSLWRVAELDFPGEGQEARVALAALRLAGGIAEPLTVVA